MRYFREISELQSKIISLENALNSHGTNAEHHDDISVIRDAAEEDLRTMKDNLEWRLKGCPYPCSSSYDGDPN